MRGVHPAEASSVPPGGARSPAATHDSLIGVYTFMRNASTTSKRSGETRSISL